MNYEDFVEGFRPVETTSGLVLKLADGIFKRICREASLQTEIFGDHRRNQSGKFG